MNSDKENTFGAPRHSYSRRQAIKDRVLVDLSSLEITRQHWRVQIACSSSVWAIVEAAVLHHGKDVQGVLHNLYALAKLHANPNTTQDRINFQATVGRTTCDFVLHVGPGDTPIPVLTLKLPSDD
jgi:hypothetical protein